VGESRRRDGGGASDGNPHRTGTHRTGSSRTGATPPTKAKTALTAITATSLRHRPRPRPPWIPPSLIRVRLDCRGRCAKGCTFSDAGMARSPEAPEGKAESKVRKVKVKAGKTKIVTFVRSPAFGQPPCDAKKIVVKRRSLQGPTPRPAT